MRRPSAKRRHGPQATRRVPPAAATPSVPPAPSPKPARPRLATLARFAPLLRLDNPFDAILLLALGLWGWGLANRGLGSPSLLALLLLSLLSLRCAAWGVVNTLFLLDYARPAARPAERLRAVPLAGWLALLLLSLPPGVALIISGGHLLLPVGGALLLALAYLPLRSRTPLAPLLLASALGGVPLYAYTLTPLAIDRVAGLAAISGALWAALLLLHHSLLVSARQRQQGQASLALAFSGAEKPIHGVLALLLLWALALTAQPLSVGVGYWIALQLLAAVLGWQLWYPWEHDTLRLIWYSHGVVAALLVTAALFA